MGLLQKLTGKTDTAPSVIPRDKIAYEVLKCKNDPVFFAKNFVFIKHPKRGQVKFSLFPFQELVLKDFLKHRFNVILKSRQMGLTELMATYILWYCLFNKDKNVLVISKNREAASNLIKRIKYSYKKLPEWLKITKYETNNVFSLEFDNDSRIYAAASTNDAGRSEACSLLIVDEAAFIPGLEEAWASLFPVVSTGGEVIVNSTPFGTAGQFYELFTQAPANNFNPIVLNWDLHPERDMEWFERTKKSINLRKFAREYLCSFELSGDTVLDSEDIMRAKTFIKEPISKEGLGDKLWIWEIFNPEHQYVIGADTARGDATDYSTFVILDVTSGEIVAEYRDKIKVDKFAHILHHVGTQLYGSSLLVVENNNMGLAVLMKLIDLRYPNLYWQQKGTNTYTEGFVDFDDDKVVPGFTTTMMSKLLIIEKLEESVRLDKFVTHSTRMMAEYENFVYVNGKPRARVGANDDLVMAFAIACFVADIVFSSNRDTSDLKLNLLSRLIMTENRISGAVRGETGFDPRKNPYILDMNDPYRGVMTNGSGLDFRGLTEIQPIKQESERKNSFITFLGNI